MAQRYLIFSLFIMMSSVAMQPRERNRSLSTIQQWDESGSSESSSDDQVQRKEFQFNQEIPMPIDRNPTVCDFDKLSNAAIENLGFDSFYEWDKDSQKTQELIHFLGLTKDKGNIYDINMNTFQKVLTMCMNDEAFKTSLKTNLRELWHEKGPVEDQARTKVLSKMIEYLCGKIEAQRKASEESDLQIEPQPAHQKQIEKNLTFARRAVCVTGAGGVVALLWALAMTYFWINAAC